METEKGVMVVAYKDRLRPRFIVLNRSKNWEGWELPKGHLEDDYIDTVKQELEEETGIGEDKIVDITDLDHTVKWSFDRDGEQVEREYRAFAVELEDDAFINVDSNPHQEHDQGFFFREQDAKSLLSYDNNVSVLEKAIEHIGN